MRTIFYKNNLARLLSRFLGINSYYIGPFIITTLTLPELGLKSINHLTTHNRQWTELAVLSSVLIWLISPNYIFLSLMTYYVFYILEYCIRYLIYSVRSGQLADPLTTLHKISFEMEAEYSEYHINYSDELNLFSWLRYLFIL